MSLKTILEERGLVPEARLRNNLDAVRNALKEMKQRRVLSKLQAFDEKLVYAPTKGRPKIINAVWTLYPSDEFVDEIINGSKQMAHARTKVGGNKSESRFLPGFQDEQNWAK